MWTFLLGAAAGFGAKFLWDYKKGNNLEFNALQYVVMGAWLAWVACGIIFVATSLGEYEPRAASLGGLIFGGTAIAALVLMRVMYLRSRKNASN